MTYDEKLQAMKQFGFGQVSERTLPAKKYFELVLDIPLDEAAEMAGQLARLADRHRWLFHHAAVSQSRVLPTQHYCFRLEWIVNGGGSS